MDTSTVLSIVSIIVTLILSIGAIILSVWFYKESNKQNKDTSTMQVEIREAVTKLEKIYDRTYTDTFSTLRTQFDAMQKYIFSSSVGNTNETELNNLRTFLLGIISQVEMINVEEICVRTKNFKKDDIMHSIYKIHEEGLIDFDGKIIKYKQKLPPTTIIEGESGPTVSK